MSRNTKVIACVILFCAAVALAWWPRGGPQTAETPPRSATGSVPVGMGEAHRALANQPSDSTMAPGGAITGPPSDAASAAAESAN